MEICLLVARNCVGNYRESFDVFRMLDNYFSLDWKAQSKTYVYIEDLTKVPEYLKRKSHFYIEGQKILQEIKEGNKVPSNAIPPQEPLPPETPDVTEETPTPDTEKDSEEG